jgi:hypothetical protein
MPITKAPPKKNLHSVDLAAFIDSAPDANTAPKKTPAAPQAQGAKPYSTLRGHQIQTTINMMPTDFDTINAAAAAAGVSRSAYMRDAALARAKRQLKND